MNLSNSAQFLPIILDSQIKWEHHVNHIIKRLFLVAYSSNILKNYVNEEALNVVYYANSQSFHVKLFFGVPPT